MKEEFIGEVSHYWSKIGVAGVELTGGVLRCGDDIHIRGVHTDFTQKVESMQIDFKNIETAHKGESIGLKLDQKAREHDKVYKTVQE